MNSFDVNKTSSLILSNNNNNNISSTNTSSTSKIIVPTSFKSALTAARRNYLAEENRKFLIHGRYELSVLETRKLRLAALSGKIKKKTAELNQKIFLQEEERKERLAVELKRRKQIVLDEKSRNIYIPMNDFCIICNRRPKTNGFLPCGHRCLCAACSITIKKICPLCNKISSNIKPMKS